VRAHSPARRTAVVAAATTWAEFPGLWGVLLAEVHAVADRTGLIVMLYKDDVPNVEVGVLIEGEFTPRGRVIESALPAGEVVSLTHVGPYERLGETHAAIHALGLPLAGPRWEIYGHAQAVPEVEVVYLLRT
jgi:effector-binding domain-containing protein